MRVTGSAVLAVLAAAGALVLAGCEPATGTAAGSGTSNGRTANCDPNGWGPFSGCRDEASDGAGAGDTGTGNDTGTDDTGTDGTGTTDGTDPTAERAHCDESGGSEAAEHPRWVRDARERCGSGDRQAEQGSPPGHVITETTRRYTVSITWIVVKIDVTGFRECVIALRAAEPDPDDHVSHRYTTPEDCRAQRVDTVYRPLDE